MGRTDSQASMGDGVTTPHAPATSAQTAAGSEHTTIKSSGAKTMPKSHITRHTMQPISDAA